MSNGEIAMKLITTKVRLTWLLAGLVLSVLSMSPAHAQDGATHNKAAQDAMEATGATARLDQILPQLAAFAKAGLIANRPDIEAEISAVVDEVAISLAPRRGALEQEIIGVYTQNFTQEELEQIAGFFNSEAGQKFLGQTPLIFKEIDEISSVWRNGVNRDLNNQVAEKLKEKGLQ